MMRKRHRGAERQESGFLQEQQQNQGKIHNKMDSGAKRYMERFRMKR